MILDPKSQRFVNHSVTTISFYYFWDQMSYRRSQTHFSISFTKEFIG